MTDASFKSIFYCRVDFKIWPKRINYICTKIAESKTRLFKNE